MAAVDAVADVAAVVPVVAMAVVVAVAVVGTGRLCTFYRLLTAMCASIFCIRGGNLDQAHP